MKTKWEKILIGEEIMTGKPLKCLFDSNIIIDQIRGYRKISDLLHNNITMEIYVSVVTEMEIYAGKSMDKTKAKNIADKLLNNFSKISIDSQIAKYAGKIKRKFSISFPDALIAATAILNNCTLITRNIKHFQKIPKLKVLQPK